MGLVLHIGLLLLLGWASYQDWKFRAIHWFIFPLIAADALLIFVWTDWSLEALLRNCLFIAAVMGMLFFYVSLREKRWTNLFERHFGLGDLLFFLAVTPLFNSFNYILFFITGMFFSATVHGLVSLRWKTPTIPLAGYLAVYVISLKAVGWLWAVDLFYQDWLWRK